MYDEALDAGQLPQVPKVKSHLLAPELSSGEKMSPGWLNELVNGPCKTSH